MTEIAPERRIYSNRTLNLRSIRAIGYDMDYTLVHYRVAEWERMAFEFARDRFGARGWPVAELTFDPGSVIRGLAIDLELGNLVKATRFGYVIRAAHGTTPLTFDEMRRSYDGVFVDLRDERFEFLNTLFSLSEAGLYAQLVDLFDQGELEGVFGYRDLYRTVEAEIDATHIEGEMKEQVVADPDRYVDGEPELVETLLDQRGAGKQLLLITNSDWAYADRMMRHAVDPYLENGTWRDLFDVVIVNARKPAFFTGFNPLYRLVDEDRSLLTAHHGPPHPGDIFSGGCAPEIEESLGLEGDQILYVGDHLYTDVHVSKAMLRWRTGLILRELESEISALIDFRPREKELTRMMADKSDMEHRLAQLRLRQQHAGDPADRSRLTADITKLQGELARLDGEITPFAIEAGALRNPTWGPLMRAGIDKSLFARQVERYADVYTSRVSNFLGVTPHAYLRAPRASLPHDVE